MLNFRIQLITVRFTSILSHSDPAVRLKGPLERLLRLNTHDDLKLLIQIAGAMGNNTGNHFSIHIQNSALITFLLRELHELFPEL
ncbi:hypothetical protein D3C74_449360 [compost metagenome]